MKFISPFLNFFTRLFGFIKKANTNEADNADRRSISFFKKNNLPKFKQLKVLPEFLNEKEQRIIKSLIGLIALCIIGLGFNFYFDHSKLLPKIGGTYTEGLVGTPQYINPIISSYNDVDRDLTALVFNGLLKVNNEGILEPDLAESYDISLDRKTYTFTLKKDVKWHDGKPLTADDVIFTIASIQDPEWQSQLKSVLDNVQVEKINDYQLRLILKEPVANFAASLTFGILPEHLWQTVPARNATLADLNKKPIGTGPFKFKTLTKDKNGNIRAIALERNADYFKQAPYIQELDFKFYGDFETAVGALANNNIEGLSLLPKEYHDKVKNDHNLNFYSLSLPQYTAVFFNTRQNEALKDKNTRQALALAIDRQKILEESLDQKGVLINGPILPGYLGFDPDLKKYDFDAEAAKKLLTDNGWKLGDDGFLKKGDQSLQITLTTVEKTEYQKAAQIIQENWKAIGVNANIEVISKDRIIPDTIEPRSYQALLYGQIIKADPYPLWHSSQTQTPGANLAIWSNKDVDRLLEEARGLENTDKINQDYIKFQEILADSVPAIFLYNPIQTYPIDTKILGMTTRRVSTPADRFTDITSWYIKTTREFSWKK